MTLSYLLLTSMFTALKKCFTRRVSRQPWIFMDILGFCVCNLVSVLNILHSSLLIVILLKRKKVGEMTQVA